MVITEILSKFVLFPPYTAPFIKAVSSTKSWPFWAKSDTQCPVYALNYTRVSSPYSNDDNRVVRTIIHSTSLSEIDDDIQPLEATETIEKSLTPTKNVETVDEDVAVGERIKYDATYMVYLEELHKQ